MTKTAKTSKKTSTLRFRLPDDLHTAFVRKCFARGADPSKTLRAFVEEFVSRHAPPLTAAPAEPATASPAPKASSVSDIPNLTDF